jgi:hypothetical protein
MFQVASLKLQTKCESHIICSYPKRVNGQGRIDLKLLLLILYPYWSALIRGNNVFFYSVLSVSSVA